MRWMAAFEHDTAGFGERQPGLKRLLKEADVTKNRAITRIRSVGNGDFRKHPRSPSESQQAGRARAVSRRWDAFLQIGEAGGQALQPSQFGVLEMPMYLAGSIRVSCLEQLLAILRRSFLPNAFKSGPGRSHLRKSRRALVDPAGLNRPAERLPAQLELRWAPGHQRRYAQEINLHQRVRNRSRIGRGHAPHAVASMPA